MKKILSITLCLLFALSLFAGCGKTEPQQTGIANPFTDYETFNEAREAIGLKVYEPDIDGYKPVNYSVCDTGEGKYLQVILENDDSDSITYRVSADFIAEELNGDYNEYGKEDAKGDSYSAVLFHDTEMEYYVAEITTADFNYCVMSDGMDYEDMQEIVSWIVSYK